MPASDNEEIILTATEMEQLCCCGERRVTYLASVHFFVKLV